MTERYMLFDFDGGELVGDTACFMPDGTADSEIEAARVLHALMGYYSSEYRFGPNYAAFDDTPEFDNGFYCVIPRPGTPRMPRYDYVNYFECAEKLKFDAAGLVLCKNRILHYGGNYR